MTSDPSWGSLYPRLLLSIIRLSIFFAAVSVGIAVARFFILPYYSYWAIVHSGTYVWSLVSLHIVYQVAEVGVLQFFGVAVYGTPKRRHARYLVKGVALACLASSSVPLLQYAVQLIPAAFTVVSFASLLADYVSARLFHRMNLEKAPVQLGFSELRAGLESARIPLLDSVLSWILWPLLTGSMLLSIASSTWLLGINDWWKYGNLLVTATLLSFTSAIIYWGLSREESKPPTNKTIAESVAVSALPFLIHASSLSYPPLWVLFILTHFGVTGLAVDVIIFLARRQFVKTATNATEQVMKLAFQSIVVLATVVLVSGVYYYLTGTGPVEWKAQNWWYVETEIVPIIPPDFAVAFNRIGVAFALAGFFLPLYLALGLVVLCSDGKTTKTRLVTLFLGCIIGYLVAVSTADGVSNPLEIGLAVFVSLIPLIIVLRSHSAERSCVELFAVTVLISAVVEVASGLTGSLRSGLALGQHAGELVLGGGGFLGIMWVSSLLVLILSAIARTWSSFSLADNEMIESIKPQNLIRSCIKLYTAMSRRRKSLVQILALILLVLVTVRPAIPSLYTVESLSAQVSASAAESISKTDWKVYVSMPSSTWFMYFEAGLKNYHYAYNSYSLGQILDTEVRMNETDEYGPLSSFFVSTSAGLFARNVTNTWDEPIAVLNNTLLENATFIDIELDPSGSWLYALSDNSTLWSISTSDYNFSRVDLEGLAVGAELRRIELRASFLCIAASHGFGVYDIEASQLVVPTQGPALSKTINDIDTDGTRVYLASDEGFMIYNLINETVTEDRTINVPAIPSPIVERIEYEHYLGGVLMATRGGLCQYHLTSQSIEDYDITSTYASLGVREILSVQDDPNLRVFISTDAGLYLFSINYGVLRNPMWPLFETINKNAVSITVAIVTSISTSVSLWLLGRSKSPSKKDS